MPDTQINVCKVKLIVKDLDQLEDEATATRLVYLEGGSKFCLSKLRDVPGTQINVCKIKPIIKDLDHKKKG